VLAVRRRRAARAEVGPDDRGTEVVELGADHPALDPPGHGVDEAGQARVLAQNRNLDPHLFSAAWRCAREVTTGRITGITPVYVGGDESYLVYTRSGGRTYATLVTGCGDTPAAGERVELSE
jgi:hypothetical protein